MLTWLIREGNYGDLRFAKDLAVVLIIHWEGNVFEKNREFGFLIDDRASPEERAALEKIFTGHAGGAFEAWRDLTLKLDGVEFVPMTVTKSAQLPLSSTLSKRPSFQATPTPRSASTAIPARIVRLVIPPRSGRRGGQRMWRNRSSGSIS